MDDDVVPSPRSHLIVPLGAVAVASTVAALAALTALILVTESDEVLATVALVLAILAFVVQIIVFIVQAATANTQSLHNQRLYGEMQRVLAEIGERTEGTKEAVSTLNERVLEAALGKVLPSTASEAGQTPQSPREIAEAVSSIVEQAPRHDESSTRTRSTLGMFLHHVPSPDDAQIRDLLKTFPAKEEAEEVMSRLRSLSPPAQDRLLRFGTDEYMFRAPGATLAPGLLLLNDAGQELADKGLVELWREGPRGDLIYVLTPEGRRTARLLTADGEPPNYLGDELPEIRRRVRGDS